MNKVILMGRLTRDPEVRYSQGENQQAIARYTIAVDRRKSKTDDSQPSADFINCKAFGRQGEFAEKYLHKGIKIAVEGRIQTGSYTNKDGQKVYTTEVIVDSHEFCEGRNADSENAGSNGGGYAKPANNAPAVDNDGFMDIPVGVEELPFGG